MTYNKSTKYHKKVKTTTRKRHPHIVYQPYYCPSIEPTQSVPFPYHPIQPTEPIQPIQPIQPSQPIEPPQPVQPTQLSEGTIVKEQITPTYIPTAAQSELTRLADLS